jgi:hypothetical protein
MASERQKSPLKHYARGHYESRLEIAHGQASEGVKGRGSTKRNKCEQDRDSRSLRLNALRTVSDYIKCLRLVKVLQHLSK